MENYDLYLKYTQERNWSEICKLNKVNIDIFGTKKEIKALPDYLEPDEVVFALTSGIMPQTETSNSFDFGSNTWLVVLTSERFLFLDAAMLTGSIDSQSIRLDKVQAVSASQGLFLGKISVDLGSRMLVIDNCMKATVKAMANVANKWLKSLNDQVKTISKVTILETPLIDLLERLDKLHILGALSEDEFQSTKSKLINSQSFQAEINQLINTVPE